MIIAKTKFEYTTKTNSKRIKASIEIESPYQRETGEWACPINLSIDGKKIDIYGEDSFQALNLALRFAYYRMQSLKENGKVYYLNSDDEYPIESTFGYPIKE